MSNFTKWCNMVLIAVRTYALAAHLTTAVPPTDDEGWLFLDSPSSYAGSIAPSILWFHRARHH
jgi:hypothetical protein